MAAGWDSGLPVALLVDGSGRIAWAGGGTDTNELDRIIPAVLAGRWDLKQAATEQNKHLAAVKIEKEEIEVAAPAYAAWERKDYAGMLAYVNARKPQEQPQLFQPKFVALLHLGREAEAFAYMFTFLKRPDYLKKTFGVSAGEWAYSGAAQVVSEDGLSKNAYRLALSLLQQCKLSEFPKGTGANFMYWEVLASAYGRLGEFDMAIYMEEISIAAVGPDYGMDEVDQERVREARRKILKEYRQKKAQPRT